MRDYNVVCIWQGLGNQMFQYAFARSLAIHTGRDVYIDAESLNKKIIGEELGSNTIRDYGLSNFNITLKQVDSLRRCLWNYTRKDKWYYEMVEILCEKGKYPYKYYREIRYAEGIVSHCGYPDYMWQSGAERNIYTFSKDS